MKNITTEIRKYKKDYLVVGFFLILSSVIRIAPIIRGDIPFLFDQGRDMVAVKQIVIDHKLTLIGPFTGLQGVFQSPLHFYLLAIPFILSHGNPAAETGMMAILALIGIFLCYFLGRKMIDSLFGIFLSALFAFSPASISMSSYFWNPNWIPFLMILFYYFLYKSIFADNKFWPWVGLIVGIIAQFEVAFGLPLFISLFIIVVLFKIKALKSFHFWLIIPVFFITFLPQIFFDIRHQFLMTKTIFSFIHGNTESVGGSIPFPTRLFYRIDEIQRATIISISNDKLIDYLLCIPIIIFLCIAPMARMTKELKRFALFTIVPVLFFIIFLFYPHEAWSWYWIGLQTSYYFILAFIFSIFMRYKWATMLFSWIMITLWVVSTIFPRIAHIPEMLPGDAGTLRHQIGVVDSLYHDANGQSFGVFVYTPPIYDYAYQSLFLWKSYEYHYAPTKDKHGIFYLIIEPDKEHPYAIKGWKETVIKTGKVLWDKTLPGDITIEKRTGKE